MGPPKECVWSHSFTVRRGTALEYAFTKGNWGTRAADATGTTAQRPDCDRDTTVARVVENWMNTASR